ncbi:MAG: fasciclin domain-containing protein [Ramlibacter sp.]
MKKIALTAAACAVTLLAACSGMPSQDMGYASRNGGTGPATMGAMETTKMVGGAPMYAGKTIVDNAVNSRDHTTLVAAVKAAGLVETLQGPGPFTVFAPTNTAFDALPAGTVPTLLKPENKDTLAKVLTYHVVPGRLDANALAGQIRAGGGKAMLRTVEGEPLVASMQGSDIVVTDAKGGTARVTTSDVYQSNGVIHVVDKVLLPG